MARDRAPSPATRKVLEVLLESGAEGLHGYAIMQATGVKSGSLYPILARLSSRGCLDAQWRSPDQLGRPPRQVYALTPAGKRYARTALAGDAKTTYPRKEVRP